MGSGQQGWEILSNVKFDGPEASHLNLKGLEPGRIFIGGSSKSAASRIGFILYSW